MDTRIDARLQTALNDPSMGDSGDTPSSRPGVDYLGPSLRSELFRFFTQVIVPGPSECWEWQGAPSTNGYGRVATRDNSDEYAHRASFRLFKGELPDDLEVMHRCHNRKCVNPTHLELGTHAENMLAAKLRGSMGRPRAYDGQEAIELVRRFEMRDCTANEFAEREGVARETLYNTVRRVREAKAKLFSLRENGTE